MISQQPFGRTGHLSTRAIFGAAAFGNVSQADADRTLEVLYQYGINHIDTAASYGDSELRIGPWMPRHRKDFFLATKTDKRTYQAAKEELHRSLERLQTDQIDLIQMHYLVKPEEWEIAFGSGGVLEALVEARSQGLVRFIGVTGHDVAIAGMHLRSLNAYDLDSVLFPYNYVLMQNPIYAENVNKLLVLCKERNIAVQTIKSISRGLWQEGQTRNTNTWYAALAEQSQIDLAVHWILSNPQVFLNTAADIHLLPKVLDAVSRFDAASPIPSEEVMQRLISEADMTPMFV